MTADRLYLITFKLWTNPELKGSQLFEKLSKDWGGKQFGDSQWIVSSDRSALQLYMDLLTIISPESDHVLIAEITANTFGTFVAQKNHEIAGLIGSARRD